MNKTFGEICINDSEFASIVHPLWHGFSPPDPLHNYIVGTVIGLVSVVAVLGNLLVLVIFSTNKSLRTPSNMLLINLAFSDMAFSLVNGFPLKTIAAFNQRWIWGKKFCDFYAFCGAIFGLASLTTLVFVSIDRYNVIVRSTGAFERMSYKGALIRIVLIWIWSAVWAILPLFGISQYILEGFQTSCTFDYVTRSPINTTYNFAMFGGAFLVPVSISVYCYIRIIQVVWANEQRMRQWTSESSRPNNPNARPAAGNTVIRAAKTSAIIIMLYLMSWTPYAIVSFSILMGEYTIITPLITELPCVFAKSSACYNPIVYAFRQPAFLRALLKHFPRLRAALKIEESRITQSVELNTTTKQPE